MIIYKLTSPENKFYIGQTIQSLPIRWQQHITLWNSKKESKNYKKTTKKLFEAFDRFDPSLWSQEILFECFDSQELNNKEIQLIKENDSIKNGYNILKGGKIINSGKLSVEHKQNLSDARKRYYETEKGKQWKEKLKLNYAGENNPMYGIKLSEEQKQTISQANKGKIVSEETRKKMSKASTGRKMSEESKEKNRQWHLGKTLSEETKQKISNKQIGHKSSEKQKKSAFETHSKIWEIIDPQGNKFIIRSLNAFCKENGLDQGNMVKVSKNQLKQHKGYKCSQIAA